MFRRLAKGEKRKRLQTILFLSLSFALGALISAVQLVPTFELFFNSFRGAENYIAQDNFCLISGQKFLTFIAPDFFGNPTTLNYWGKWNYQETALYLGILPLFFLTLHLLRKKTKLTLFYLAFILLPLFLIFDSPIGRLVYIFKIPFFSQNFASRGIYLLA